jgi:hypothetical protein
MTATTNPNKALWEKGDFTQIAAAMRECEADLQGELEALFNEKNKSDDATSIPATFLRVTVTK